MSKTLACILVIVLAVLFPVYVSALFLRYISNTVIRVVDALTDAIDMRLERLNG